MEAVALDLVDHPAEVEAEVPRSPKCHKAYIEKVMDKSCPALTKDELANYFKRRQYKLQHKRHKLLLRWAHHCLTSDIVD